MSEELCPKCRKAKEDRVSIKNGKRCRFVCQKKAMGPFNGCALKVVADCGHKTDIPKHSGGECIGADNCPDYA